MRKGTNTRKHIARLLCFILSAVILLGMAGCGEKEAVTTLGLTTAGNQTTAAKTTATTTRKTQSTTGATTESTTATPPITEIPTTALPTTTVPTTTIPTTTAPTTTTPTTTENTTTIEELTTAPPEELPPSEPILNTTNRWKYSFDFRSGVIVRDLTIKTNKGGDPLTLYQITDMHINYCNEKDLKDPVLKSTYENRLWLKDGASLPNVKACMEVAKDGDMILLTGDIYDYYSEGVVEKANEYIFDKYDNVMACIGNHEPVRRMQGTVPETLTDEELRALVAESWCNDITYASTVLGEKVMLILMDNSLGHFLDEQLPLLTKDLREARENGYAVLLFYHVPLNSGKQEDVNLKSDRPNNVEYWNLGTNSGYVGRQSKGTDAKIYSLIRRNGDIIRGAFCGHVHSDFYTEIPAFTEDGEDTFIPQYVLTGAAYEGGHVLRVTVE